MDELLWEDADADADAASVAVIPSSVSTGSSKKFPKRIFSLANFVRRTTEVDERLEDEDSEEAKLGKEECVGNFEKRKKKKLRI